MSGNGNEDNRSFYAQMYGNPGAAGGQQQQGVQSIPSLQVPQQHPQTYNPYGPPPGNMMYAPPQQPGLAMSGMPGMPGMPGMYPGISNMPGLIPPSGISMPTHLPPAHVAYHHQQLLALQQQQEQQRLYQKQAQERQKADMKAHQEKVQQQLKEQQAQQQARAMHYQKQMQQRKQASNATTSTTHTTPAPAPAPVPATTSSNNTFPPKFLQYAARELGKATTPQERTRIDRFLQMRTTVLINQGEHVLSSY